MEGFNNENKINENQKRSFFEVVKDSAKIASLLMMFSLPVNEIMSKEVSAGEKEVSIELNKEAIQKIRSKLIEINKDQVKRIGDTEILEHSFAGQNIIMPKHDSKYTLIISNDGKLTLYDKNSDGEVDEVLMNEQEEKRTLVDNITALNEDMPSLLNKAEFLKGSPMEMNIRIVRFNKENKEAQFLDTKKIEGGTMGWDEATKIYEDAQNLYSSKLQEISKEIK